MKKQENFWEKFEKFEKFGNLFGVVSR